MTIIVSLSLFLISGCWDRNELNEQAIWLATGWDISESGEIEVSGQVIIPANTEIKHETILSFQS